jgi:hypothetical protein
MKIVRRQSFTEGTLRRIERERQRLSAALHKRLCMTGTPGVARN